MVPAILETLASGVCANLTSCASEAEFDLLLRHDPEAPVLLFANRLELALSQRVSPERFESLESPKLARQEVPAGSPCRRRDAQASVRRTTGGRPATLSMDSRASISRSSTAASCRSSSDINLKLASSLKWGISART